MTSKDKHDSIFEIMDGIMFQLSKTKKMFMIMIITTLIIPPIALLAMTTTFDSPFYDRFEKMQLDGYWRTDSVELIQGGGNPLFNIYGEPLLPCRSQGSSDQYGSWNQEGLCNETGGGVHQICVNVDKVPKFSESKSELMVPIVKFFI